MSCLKLTLHMLESLGASVRFRFVLIDSSGQLEMGALLAVGSTRGHPLNHILQKQQLQQYETYQHDCPNKLNEKRVAKHWKK